MLGLIKRIKDKFKSKEEVLLIDGKTVDEIVYEMMEEKRLKELEEKQYQESEEPSVDEEINNDIEFPLKRFGKSVFIRENIRSFADTTTTSSYNNHKIDTDTGTAYTTRSFVTPKYLSLSNYKEKVSAITVQETIKYRNKVIIHDETDFYRNRTSFSDDTIIFNSTNNKVYVVRENGLTQIGWYNWEETT